MSSEVLSHDEALAKVQDLIRNVRIAMLTTADENGRLLSRPMATQKSRFQGELWFLTRQDSGKVNEIQQNTHVNVTYTDTENSTFVSLSGRADVSKDRAKIHELWNPLYKAWFPNGEEDPEISVLRVKVEEAEYWEAPSNALVRNFQILKAAVTKGASQVGEHQRVTLDRSA